jgi:hypothetical protein
MISCVNAQTTLTVNNTGSGDIADFLSSGSTTKAEIDTSGDFITGLSGVYSFSSFSGSPDTSLSRGGPGLVDVNGASSTAGFVKTAQTLIVTSDFSTTNTGLTAITGLTLTLPSSVNWGFSCDLVVSQVNGVGGDKIGIQAATNAASGLTAGGFIGFLGNGAVADISNSTAQTLVTFTAVSGTKYPVHIGGGVIGPSVSGTTLTILVATGNASDSIVVSEGSACWVY